MYLNACSTISVKRKGLGSCESMKAIEEAMPSLKDETVDKQLLPSGVRLLGILANEEFDKETVVYQSVTDKDNEAEAFVECAPDGDVAFKKRKETSPIEMTKYVFEILPHSCHGVRLCYLSPFMHSFL